MNGPEWASPVVESLHFIGLALSIGTIAIVDLRLLGIGMRRLSAGELAADLDIWTWIGLALMLITGPLMFSADAVNYRHNPSFQFKMMCLSLARVPLHGAPPCDPLRDSITSCETSRRSVACPLDLRGGGGKNDCVRVRTA